MNSMEKSMLLDELFTLRKADKEETDRLSSSPGIQSFCAECPLLP